MNFSEQAWAKIAALFSGVMFGIYWIPLRLMDDAGFAGLWAVMLFSAVAFLLIIPVLLFNSKALALGRLRLHRNAALAGLAFVLYSAGFLYTEVIRVIILFYLMPIWGFLFARIFTSDKITAVRWISMSLGLAGLFIICGIDSGPPIPRNLGDWFALSAGIVWAGSATCILTDKQDSANYTVAFLFWSAIIALAFAVLITYTGDLVQPDWQNTSTVLKWFIPFAILIVIPTAFATVYAPSKLNPGIVGLLFMVEVVVGVISAALFAGEAIGNREILGVALIIVSGATEPIYQLFKQRPTVQN